MHNMKRLIAYYREPGNWWRLIFTLLLALLMLFNVLLTLQTTYCRISSSHSLITNPLYRFLESLPVLAVAGLWLFLVFFACKRASFDVPWRIRIPESLPILLLAVAAFSIRIVYDMQIS